MYTTREVDGERWVPVRRICEDLGIALAGQTNRLKGNPNFNRQVIKMEGIDGRRRKMVCIPEHQIELFKSSLNYKKINSSKKPQYTYILWDGKADFVKIGKTNDPLRRLKTHQHSHKSLQIIYLVEGDKEPYFKKDWDYLRIDDQSEHWWITPQLIEAWEQFEDVNHQFY